MTLSWIIIEIVVVLSNWVFTDHTGLDDNFQLNIS